MYIYGRGFARTRNDDRRRIIIIIIIIIITIIIIIITIIIIIIIINKPFLKIFNECSSPTGVGELNPLERKV
jgi:flagellar basal body-associated protein FliL